MKIWKNTKTLDDYSEGLVYTDDKNEAEIALLGSKPIELDDFPNLKGIFRAGVSKDNVPVELASQRGIECCWPAQSTIDIIYEETANFACAMVMHMQYSQVGTLDPWVKFDRSFLNDLTLLVVGTGNIGQRVVDKMSSFLNVITYDAMKDDAASLDAKIAQADFISLHIPSTGDNKGFFGKEKLALMKDGAVLINAARGAVVDEDALYDEMKTARIRAAFDVYWIEPYEGKLTEFHPEPFYMTPHVASTNAGFLQGSANDLKALIQRLSN